MINHSLTFCILPAMFALYMPMCSARVQPTVRPWDAHMAEFWRVPRNLADRDLFYGPWGVEHAPDTRAAYTLVTNDRTGNGDLRIVQDSRGREWQVTSSGAADGTAAPQLDVVMSRVLSAVGYHQTPVYFLPSFTMRDRTGTHTVAGGVFRLNLPSLERTGEWSWERNPFVGTKPYQGLLVIRLMFGSQDLSNAHNELLRVRNGGGEVETRYVAGGADVARRDAALLDRPLIAGVKNGYIEFGYHGSHQELVRQRITPEEAHWASELLRGLSDSQWMDAFRAGGYEPAEADRLVRRLQARVDQAYGFGFLDPHVNLRARAGRSSF